MPHHDPINQHSISSLIATIVAAVCGLAVPLHAQIDSKSLSADIVRVISKDLFDLNSLPFMQPMVETFNATANAGFYRTAYIPTADTFYIHVGLRGMFGLIRDDQRTYKPAIPTEASQNDVASPLAVGLATKIKEIFKRGIEEDSIQVPAESATVLGHSSSEFRLNNAYLLREIRKDMAYQQAITLFGLDPTIIDQALMGLPDVLTLPSGADISSIIAIVPQIELGALYGTELTLRFIPPVKLDTNVGRFSFWGIGIRHNMSRYFTSTVDIAALVAYQKTSLDNIVGPTRAQLQADGSTFNASIHASKRFGYLSLYSGLGLESTSIDISYTYTLPRELQAQLGLITPKDINGDGHIDDDEYVPDHENGFPGDTKPQTSRVEGIDTGITWTIGSDYLIGPVHLFADLNIGKFPILSGGLMVEL